MKKVLIIIIVSLIFFSCGNKVEEKNMEIVYAWEAETMTQSNAMLCSGFYKGQIYYAEDNGDNFGIRFVSLDGETQNRFDIPKGRGPGEAQHTLGVKVYKDHVYFTDFVLRRITKFNLDGEYIDNFDFTKNTGYIVSFDFIDKEILFHSISNTKFGKMNIETGDIVKRIKHSRDTVLQPGDKVDTGILEIDEKSKIIYFGHLSVPYKIEKFDYDFNKIGEIKYKLDKNYEPTQVAPGPNIYGNMVIMSLGQDDRYLYSPKMSARFFIEDNGRPDIKKFYPKIIVFDKKTDEPKYILKNDLLKDFQGFLTIVKVTDKYIIVHLMGQGKSINKILNTDTNEGFSKGFVVFKKNID